MPEPTIAPDAKLWAQSLTPEQALFIITVWNDGGEKGLNEMLLFVFDVWEAIPPDKRREIVERATQQFFSEEAYAEFASYSMRKRYFEEMQRQGAVKPSINQVPIIPDWMKENLERKRRGGK